MKPRSWVWKYAYREGIIAYCNLCSEGRNNTFSCRGGTTGSLGRHLQAVHAIHPTVTMKTAHNSLFKNTSSSSRDEQTRPDRLLEAFDHLEAKNEVGCRKFADDDLNKNDSSCTYQDDKTESCWGNSFDGVAVKTEISVDADDVDMPITEADDGDFQSTIADDIDYQTIETYDRKYVLEDAQCESPCSKKRRTLKTKVEESPKVTIASSKRIDDIHQALAKMIAINQMPISFCSSEGFLQFMAIVDPSYEPVSEEIMKKRLEALKRTTENFIRQKMEKVPGVSFSTECWNTDQASYVTIKAHLIDENWTPLSFTLETVESTRYGTSQLAKKIEEIFEDWGLADKVMGVVSGNAAHVARAVESMRQGQENLNNTCAAYSLQLTVKSTISSEYIQRLVEKIIKVVGFLKHSNVAKYALLEEQKQSGLPEKPLIETCFTKWASILAILQWIIQNRDPVSSVLKDRTVTSPVMYAKLKITDEDWISIKELAKIVRPIEALTKIVCNENSSAAMVRPLVHKLLQNHMLPFDGDSDMKKMFKNNFSLNLRQRFHLEDNNTSEITGRQIASLLDPRYKDLEHESSEVRVTIREKLNQLLSEYASLDVNFDLETTKSKNVVNIKTEFDILYNTSDTNNPSDISTKYIQNQLEAYLDEPQLKFNLNPYEWWKNKESKYPTIALMARKYLSIPAISPVSSGNRFSSTETIVAAESSSLLLENIDLLVFLYQNRKYFNC